MKQKLPIDAKKIVFKLITFFLLVVIFFNLIGNFVGISNDYTYYFWGLNAVAIFSRFIENSVLNIGLRIFLLGLITMVSSSILFILYHYGRKGKKAPLAIAVIIYFIDYLLVFTPIYRESEFSFVWSSFIHLTILALVVATGLLYLLINPGGDCYNHDFEE